MSTLSEPRSRSWICGVAGTVCAEIGDGGWGPGIFRMKPVWRRAPGAGAICGSQIELAAREPDNPAVSASVGCGKRALAQRPRSLIGGCYEASPSGPCGARVGVQLPLDRGRLLVRWQADRTVQPAAVCHLRRCSRGRRAGLLLPATDGPPARSEEHTPELQSPCNLVCRHLL